MNVLHYQLITPISVIHHILQLEIQKPVAMHCCMFLWHVMEMHQRENCTSISPACIHDAIAQIENWGIHTQQITVETFEAMLPYVTGT